MRLLQAMTNSVLKVSPALLSRVDGHVGVPSVRLTCSQRSKERRNGYIELLRWAWAYDLHLATPGAAACRRYWIPYWSWTARTENGLVALCMAIKVSNEGEGEGECPLQRFLLLLLLLWSRECGVSPLEEPIFDI
jgi:hypothetical protein